MFVRFREDESNNLAELMSSPKKIKKYKTNKDKCAKIDVHLPVYGTTFTSFL